MLGVGSCTRSLERHELQTLARSCTKRRAASVYLEAQEVHDREKQAGLGSHGVTPPCADSPVLDSVLPEGRGGNGTVTETAQCQHVTWVPLGVQVCRRCPFSCLGWQDPIQDFTSFAVVTSSWCPAACNGSSDFLCLLCLFRHLSKGLVRYFLLDVVPQ